jgi:hypothetical protein
VPSQYGGRQTGGVAMARVALAEGETKRVIVTR